jgi:lysophospholipase L1-like esterase
MFVQIALAAILGLGACAAGGERPHEGKGELKPLRGAARILFLGDSITYAGGFVDEIEAWLIACASDIPGIQVIDAGLPSETVSGLTEPNHAGGAFPRPDLHDRLDRALALVKPDLVVACYGMNDGIYYPPDEERFRRYRDGIAWLRDRVLAAHARLWLVTPPPFDPKPVLKDTLPAGRADYPSGHPYAQYDRVLGAYSKWLLDRRGDGWNVIDIHGPLNAWVRKQRRTDPGFTLTPDGVHPNETGHLLIANAILSAWGAGRSTLTYAGGWSADADAERRMRTLIRGRILPVVRARRQLLSDAWLTAIGHKRPGMPAGVPLAEAEREAEELTRKIDALLKQPMTIPN